MGDAVAIREGSVINPPAIDGAASDASMSDGNLPDAPFPADPAQAFANSDYDNYYDSSRSPHSRNYPNADVPSPPYLQPRVDWGWSPLLRPILGLVSLSLVAAWRPNGHGAR